MSLTLKNLKTKNISKFGILYQKKTKNDNPLDIALKPTDLNRLSKRHVHGKTILSLKIMCN